MNVFFFILTSLSSDALQVSCDFVISEVKTFRQLYQFNSGIIYTKLFAASKNNVAVTCLLLRVIDTVIITTFRSGVEVYQQLKTN